MRRIVWFGRSALAGALFAFVSSHIVVAFAGWPYPDVVRYCSLVSGAVAGLVAAWWPDKAKPRPLPYSGPTPALVAAYRTYQDHRRAHERRLAEPEAARLGISVDDLLAAYGTIEKGMKNA